MDTILFNFHDLVLVLTAFECLLMASLLTASNKTRSLAIYLLVGFLLCHFLIPVHELTFWGKQFRLWLLNISPNLFFLGSYAYFLDGPLLYFFIRATLYKDFAFRRIHLLHLLPLALYACHMLVFFYSLDYSERFHLISSQHIAYSSPYLYFEAAGRYLRLVYMVFCFVLALNYGEQLKNVYANVNKGDLSWIKIMIASFILLTAWDVALLNIKLFELWGHNFDLDLLNIVGLSSYYLNFLMLNILIFFKFTTFASVAKVDELVEQEVVTESQPELSDSEREMLNRLKRVMEADKFYITPDITLDMLAEQVGIPAKKLSHSIRQQYHLNFYEFINNYRIAEAKRLLSDPQQALKSITEIYFAVGFNSKSVFNTFFKRVEGVTPSQYREKVLDAKVS